MYNPGKYTALDVAEYVLHHCNDKKISITHIQLQKILYFLNGEWIRKTGEFLIDENFYAWKMGPVIRDMYDNYSIHGSLTIYPDKNFDMNSISKDDWSDLNNFIDRYAVMKTCDIVEMSRKTSPWKKAIELFGEESRISKNSIEKYFKGNDFSKLLETLDKQNIGDYYGKCELYSV